MLAGCGWGFIGCQWPHSAPCGEGLMANHGQIAQKSAKIFFARFCVFMVLRAPFAPPPLKWRLPASHCGRLTATLPTPKINGPMDDEDHFFFFFVGRFGACFLGGGTSAWFCLVCGRFRKASPSAFLFDVLGSFRPSLPLPLSSSCALRLLARVSL